MAGVNVKMGVSGVTQFKQSMTQAKNSVKTLDEALKLNEKQFKATGDAQEYSQKKADLLNQKLAEQQKVVESAEKALETMTRNGVDKASTAFQKMRQTMLRAKSDVLDTSNQIAGIADSADEAASGVEGMASSLNSINTQVSFETVTNGINTITGGLEGLAKKAWKVGEQIVRSTLGAGSWADELATTASEYQQLDPSMTPEKLQRMRKTADLIDTDVETIISAKNKMAQALKTKEVDDVFASFGIQNTRYGEIEELDDLFWDVGEALMNVDNTAKRAQMGQQLFGKQWTKLAPLFEAGEDEYNRVMEAQSVVTQEQLDGLLAMDDQYQNLQNEIETLKMQFLSELSPATTTVMETLTGLVREFNDYLQTEEGKEAMTAFSDAVTSLFTDISEIDPEEALKGLQGGINSLKEAFVWIKDNKQGLVDALKFVITGWAGLKLTGGVLDVWKFINGLKGFGASGKAIDPTSTVSGVAKGGAAGAAAGAGAGVSFATKVAMKAGALGSSTVGNLIGPAVMGTMALGDYTAGGRALQNGASIGEAWEAEKEALSKIVSDENINAFKENWNPLGEDANVIAKGIGNTALSMIDDWNKSQSGESNIVGDVIQGVTDAAQGAYDLYTNWANFWNQVWGVDGNKGGGNQSALDSLEPMASTEYADLLKDLAGQYTRAFVDQESEPFIESIFNNLDDDLGNEFSSLLEKIGAGDMVDPMYAMQLTDQVRAALTDSGIDLTDASTIVGENASIGLANGIDAKAGEAIAAAEALAIDVANIMQQALDIHSPSRVMEQLGEFVSAGFAEGIEGGFGRVNDAVSGMADIAAGTRIRSGSAGGGTGTISVTLNLDSERLTEVLVPLMNESMGEELNLVRR